MGIAEKYLMRFGAPNGAHFDEELGPNLQECVHFKDLHQKDKILFLQWKIPL